MILTNKAKKALDTRRNRRNAWFIYRVQHESPNTLEFAREKVRGISASRRTELINEADEHYRQHQKKSDMESLEHSIMMLIRDPRVDAETRCSVAITYLRKYAERERKYF